MLRHYYNTAIRNLLRNRLFTVINILGLSISMAIFLALTSYVSYQFSYDKFYPGGEQIYRIDYFEYQQGQPVLESARTHDRTAFLVHEYVPEVEAVTRVYNEKAYVFTEDIRIVDQDMLFADSSFLKVFPIKLISGDPETALKAPHTLMISKSQARVYFREEDPMGKTIFFNEHLPFVITGVFEDIPENSSMDYDFLLSWSTMTYNGWVTREGNFETPWTFTFVKLRPQASDVPKVNGALTKLVSDHMRSLQLKGHTATHQLRAYEELHTSRDLSGEIKPGVNRSLLYALLSLAVFILVAAWINFINLSVARSLERAGEIGVRRVFGATRSSISAQFVSEAIILAIVTFATGFGLYYLLTTTFSELIFNQLTVEPPGWKMMLLYFAGFITSMVLIAFYPAHFVSRFKPALILKNKLISGRGSAGLLQQGLMVFQLFLAVAIVGVTIIASRQVNFMRDFDSGFNVKGTITLRAPASTNSDSLRYTRYTSFRSEVLQMPQFTSGTASMNIPGQEIRFHDESVHAVGSINEKKQSFWVMMIDEGYQQTFGMTLVAGRNFNEQERGNTCIINESAAKALGYSNPQDAVNTEIITNDQKKHTIVGLWKDYHHQSIRKSVDPILFFYRHPWEYGYYSFGVQTRNNEYLSSLEKIWNKHYPNDQFIFYFMDSFFEEQFRADELFGRLLSLFSIISILVASLGLFGMASLAIVKRTKEIAVRKVLGATVPNLLVLLSRHYLRLILVGCAFAFPLAYMIMSKWLEQFAYKITIEWWMILLPGILVLATTLVTIATRAIRAALANPAQSLRDQ